MICPVCGRYAEPDRETGYDADDRCPQCLYREQFDGLYPKKSKPARGEVDPIESDLHDMGSVLASLADLVKDCHDPAKLFDVYCELGKIAAATMQLQDWAGEHSLKVRR